jgi:signal transduction histidine kinase
VFGLKKGLAYMLVLELCVLFLFFGAGDQLLLTSYPLSFKIRFFVAFTGVILVAAAAEYSRQQAHQHLLRLLKEQRKTEQKRMALEEQLRESQKLEAVGRLAGGVAHDFNNLLTGIISYANFVGKELDPQSRAWKDLSVVVDAANRAGNLTSQLLAFGRKQVIHLKVLDLNRIVIDAAKEFSPSMGESIDIEIDTDSDLGRVAADPTQIKQVLMNLVINARDAMPNGGKLTVRTGNVQLNEAFCQAKGDCSPGEYVALTVCDTGLGMGDVTRVNIFEPFFSTKKKNKSSGLGLSTVYGIAKQNKGCVDVQSKPDRGTTIAFQLPRVYEAPTTASPPPAIAAGLGKRQTILLAEDEDIVRRSAMRMLTANNYKVLEAASGEEALELAAAYQGKIDLLLTDVIMTGITGNVLAKELTSSRPETRVLFMSGYTADAIADHGVIRSDMHFLEKPFSADQLLGMTRQAISSPI